jgi:hypothetical protein
LNGLSVWLLDVRLIDERVGLQASMERNKAPTVILDAIKYLCAIAARTETSVFFPHRFSGDSMAT